MTAEELVAAMPEEAWARLTKDGDEELTKLLATVVTKLYGLGYEEGLRRGAQLLAQALKNRMGQR